MSTGKRGGVNCDHSFGIKQKKFSIAIKALNYFEVSLGVENQAIEDAQGNVAFLMERQLAYCIVWNATSEPEYPTKDYLSDLDAIGAWFLELETSLAVIAQSLPKKDTNKPPDPATKKDLKKEADDLLKKLKDAVAAPSKAPKDKTVDAMQQAKKKIEKSTPKAAFGRNIDLDGNGAEELEGDLKAALAEEQAAS